MLTGQGHFLQQETAGSVVGRRSSELTEGALICHGTDFCSDLSNGAILKCFRQKSDMISCTLLNDPVGFSREVGLKEKQHMRRHSEEAQ